MDVQHVDLFDVVTLLQARQSFGHATAFVDHDVLGLDPDIFKVRLKDKPNVVFYCRLSALRSFPVLEGKRLSFGTFSMTPTGDVFEVTGDMIAWAESVSQAMKIATRSTDLIQ